MADIAPWRAVCVAVAMLGFVVTPLLVGVPRQVDQALARVDVNLERPVDIPEKLFASDSGIMVVAKLASRCLNLRVSTA